MMNKVAVWVVSIVLVVGVIVGVSSVANSGHGRPKPGPNKSSTGSMKTVTSICELTQYKGACVRSLSVVARNATATSKDYVLAVVEAALKEVNSSSTATYDIVVDRVKAKTNYLALQDCKTFLHLAWDRLQDTIAAIRRSPDLNNMEPDRVHELLTWTTGVHAFHTSCLDDLNDPQFKSVLQIALRNSTELSHNAVNVVAGIPTILKLFNESDSRRSMAAFVDGSFPSWVKTADRRLLAVQPVDQIKPDVVVAKDGTGNFKTIRQAIAAYPIDRRATGRRYVIHVKAGLYREQIKIDNDKPNVFIYGDGIGKSIITAKKNSGYLNTKTMHTATFANDADGFMARGLTFRNDAGTKGLNAVAFRSMGDRVAIFDCCFEGNQNTLFYQTFRQFYRNCLIYGTVDVIFGKGEAVIQDSEIIVRKPMPGQTNTVTTDGKEIMRGSNGLVLQHCKIVPDKNLFPERFQIPTYLGRPYTPESLTVVMQTELGDFIRPEGWLPWEGAVNHNTCHVYEYANSGPGANTTMRNKMFANFQVVGEEEAGKYAVGRFLAGGDWLPKTGFPHRLGL